MGVEGVDGLEGRVGCDGDGAVAAGEEEVGGWCGMVEGHLVRLEGLLYGSAGGGSWVDGNRDQIVGAFLYEVSVSLKVVV